MTLPNAAPKPPKREPKPRKELKRSSPVARSKTPIKKQGETKRKKVIRQKSFYASRAWKLLRNAAIARAGRQCEYATWYLFQDDTFQWVRCEETTRLHIHHVTNVRFGGDERPEDLQVLCRDHHMRLHALEGKHIPLSRK